jgi:two-component system cell cycle sensor histidine kinase/response regulator CckA
MTQTPLVLVVDDEAPIRSMEARILQNGGYRVLEAAGPRAALEMLNSGVVPDLLIADLEMPELSGEEMVRHFHAVLPGQKVLYVTGNIDRLLDSRSLLRDDEAFLEKPFTAQGLLEAVSLLLTHRISVETTPPRRIP